MNYYLMFEKFESGEGTFTVKSPWNNVLQYYQPQIKLLKNRPTVYLNTQYNEKGMSDFLKIPMGMLASKKVQQIFFDKGFSGVQFLPVDVKNDVIVTDFAFMNVTAHYDLLDPAASEAEGFSKTLGGYTGVLEEMLDLAKFESTNIEHDCFTLSTYKDPYYVSEKVKDALEDAGITGIEFIPMEFS
ncbi:hypothetical protein VST7929_00722 [Vibrio stylophorae]|uniref:Immunity MXAN-0049 protein domain-containing protein n=1 Tax=Vibrio stylophorae TaxID=659351 RepID=A0ABM8ZRE4_9VIBR|nr:DUF1629 domain-containing protein [Vibrio stylophorae]CAH0532875.1 hypothetical protein VST7929_00722 [Vibrio stylophorae]